MTAHLAAELSKPTTSWQLHLSAISNNLNHKASSSCLSGNSINQLGTVYYPLSSFEVAYTPGPQVIIERLLAGRSKG